MILEDHPIIKKLQRLMGKVFIRDLIKYIHFIEAEIVDILDSKRGQIIEKRDIGKVEKVYVDENVDIRIRKPNKIYGTVSIPLRNNKYLRLKY